jgi:activating signal cointegrator complex subunit 3
LESVVGYTVQDSIVKKIAQLAQKLGSLQQTSIHGFVHGKVEAAEENDRSEFGADFDFKPPGRFIFDVSLDDDLVLESDGSISKPFEKEQYDASFKSSIHDSAAIKASMSLRWLKDQCALITRSGGSMLSGDELAMALCRVLISSKAGDEVFNTLLNSLSLSLPHIFWWAAMIIYCSQLPILQIAGELLDLVGDAAFETVQHLLLVRDTDLLFN